MPEIKRLEPLTDWIAYEFDGTPFLAEQTIRLRLRFLDNIEAAEEYVRSGLRSPRATANLALNVIAAWDLTEARGWDVTRRPRGIGSPSAAD